MAEENQETKGQVTTKGLKEVTTKGPKELTTKDPRRVEQGKQLQETNCRRKAQKRVNQYVIRVVLAVGVIEGLGYYLYQIKKGIVPSPQEPQLYPQRSPPKFEMD